MKILKTTFLILTILGINRVSNAQDLTNEGMDFWCAFTEMFDHTSAIYEINISSRQPANGTVEIPGTGFVQAFSVTPGLVTNVALPSVDANIETAETVLNRGIHITSDVPVTAFASTFHLYRSEATVLLPYPSMGSNYIVTSYKNFMAHKSQCTVVAGSDPCEVEITAACATMTHAAGDTWTVNLDPGEIYMIQADAGATNDLTGTTIKAVDGEDKFAVFNGHRFVQVAGCASGTKDPLYEIAFPIESLGKDHIVVKTEGQNRNAYRIVAIQDNTEIFENGISLGFLDAGESYDALFTVEALRITADKPIALNQTMVNANCSLNNAADPAMVAINPNEQMYIDTATFYAVDYNTMDENYVNIITRTSETALVQLNAVPVGGWTPAPGAPGYSYTIVPITPGSYTITTTGCGFLAYTYGHQWAESYFYSAGARVNEVEDSIAFEQHIGTNDNFCDVDTVKFTPYTSGGPVLSYQWWFGDGATSTEAAPLHVYNTDGEFEVELVVEYQCEMDTIIDTVEIYSSPEINSDITDVSCYGYDNGEIDATVVGGTAGYSFLWNTGATTEDVTDLGAGNYTVEVTDDKGCKAYDTVDVTEPEELELTMSTVGPVCFGGTGEASVDIVSGGTGTYDYNWTSGGTSATETVLSAGDYTVTVTDDNGCSIDSAITITEPEKVVVPAFSDTTICVGGSIELEALATGGSGDPYTYTWTDGVIAIPGGITFPGVATCYSVVAEDVNGCLSDPETYCVDILDPLSITISTEDICQGEPAELNATPSGGNGDYTFSWTTVSSGEIGTSEDLTTAQDVSAVEYCLTLGDGCETPDETQCVTVNVMALPDVNLEEQAGCAPFNAGFEITDPDEVISVTTWNFGDGTSASGLSVTNNYEYSGLYDVELSVETIEGCLLDTLFESAVEVYEIPHAAFEYYPNDRAITVEDTEVDFTNTSVNGYWYSWDFGDGSVISSATDPSHTFPTEGNQKYIVTLTVESEHGCVDETEKTIFIEDVLIYYVPNAFTPDGDQYNDEFLPIFTEGFDPYDYHMTVFNRWGEIMFESYNAAKGWDGTYKGQGLAEDGVYIWKIEFGETHTDKKQHINGHVTILK